VKSNLCSTIVNLLQTDDKCVHTDTVLDMLINMSEWGKYVYRQIGHFPCDVCRWITELNLIHKNIRSVRNSHAQVYRSIWRKTHYDVTDKNNNVSSEGLRLAGILVIMSV